MGKLSGKVLIGVSVLLLLALLLEAKLPIKILVAVSRLTSATKKAGDDLSAPALIRST